MSQILHFNLTILIKIGLNLWRVSVAYIVQVYNTLKTVT